MQDDDVKRPNTGGRAARWASHRVQRREELIEAAVNAIREHGAGVSVAAMAAAAGVTKPVLYRHFVDRADLQRAVSERAAKLLVDRLVPELTSDRAPLERLRAIVDAFLAAAEEEPELWRFVVHNPGGERAASEEVVAHNMAMVAGMLTSVLVDVLRQRGRDAGGAEAWAYGLAGMVYTAGDWWLQRRTLTRAALTDYLTSLIWGGLSTVLDADSQSPRDAKPGGGRRNPDQSLRLVAGLDEQPS
jgi:AcrR family transcriptional regulator